MSETGAFWLLLLLVLIFIELAFIIAFLIAN